MRIAFVFALLLSFTPLSSAQIDKGVIEVGGGGSIILSPDFVVTLSPQAGYFVTPKIQIGASPVLVTDFEDTTGFLTVIGAYYPSGGEARTTYPFVGAQLGASFTGDGSGLAIGARAGVQRFVSESAAITLSANLLTTDDFDVGAALISLNAGFSLFLRR
ncbi:MAG: hypothetical protein AAGK21_15185 [Bacteroidota bacterium]